jgi:hypothetical protein
MREKPYTEQEFDEMEHDKNKIREYFTNCATKMFTRANKLPAGQDKLFQMRVSLTLFKYMDEFVESSYKGPK